MKSHYRDIYDITIEFKPGTHISNACEQATRLAQELETKIQFQFNGVKLNALEHSNPNDLFRIYTVIQHKERAK